MGTNKRYAEYYDRQMDARILQRIAADFPLQSLTERELQAASLPVTRDPQPKPCKAWVRFGPHAMLVDGVVVVWNDLACGIEFTIGERHLRCWEHRCWVWANAVTPT